MAAASSPVPYPRQPRHQPQRVWTRRSSCPGTTARWAGPAPARGSGTLAAGPGPLSSLLVEPAGPAGQSRAGGMAAVGAPRGGSRFARPRACHVSAAEVGSAARGVLARPYLPVMAVLRGIADLVVQLLCQQFQGRQPLQAQPALRHCCLHKLWGICEHCWCWGQACVAPVKRDMGHCVPCEPGRGCSGTGTHQPGAAKRAL